MNNKSRYYTLIIMLFIALNSKLTFSQSLYSIPLKAGTIELTEGDISTAYETPYNIVQFKQKLTRPMISRLSEVGITPFSW